MARRTSPSPDVVALWSPLALLLGSCASAPTPIAAPDMRIEVDHYRGGVLSGARVPVAESGAAASPVSLEEVLAVELRAWVWRRAPRDDRAAAAAAADEARTTGAQRRTTGAQPRTTGAQRNATLIVEPDTDDPIRGRAPELGDVAVAFGADAVACRRVAERTAADPMRGLELARQTGLLYRDVVSRLSVAVPNAPDRWVSLSRDGTTVRVALGREGRDAEVALLAPRLDPDAHAVARGVTWLEWPLERSGDPGAPDRFGVAITVRTADGLEREDVIRAFRRAEEQVRVAEARAAETVARFADEARDARRLAVTWNALTIPQSRRRALLGVLASGGESDRALRVARDYAAWASEQILERWVETLTASSSDEPASIPAVADAAWLATRTGLRVLGERVDGDLADDAEIGLLLRGFGEVARFPGDLVGALVSSPEPERFFAWVVQENRRLLGSSDPAARVRALDWLRDVGEAPAAFDPFASRDARRAALRADEDAREAATTPERSDQPEQPVQEKRR